MAKKPRRRATKHKTARRGRGAKSRARVAAIPPGMHAVTPYLAVRDAARALEFYKQAFGARERMRLAMPDGRIMHAELRIGDSAVFLADEFPNGGTRAPEALGGTSVSVHLFVRNVDRAFERAVAAGARVTMPLADMFWGDRFGTLADPFGHVWSLAQHVEDVSPKQMRVRAAAAFPPPAPA